jgi:hypothetical protein
MIVVVNSNAKATELGPDSFEVKAAALSHPPAAKPEPTSGVVITPEQAAALGNSLRPSSGLNNPVAAVQAKLRAALEDAPPAPSRLQNTAFVTFLVATCTFMVTIGVVVGVICVLFGAAMFLFPVSAGLALGAFVVTVSALIYFIYTRGVSPKTAKPAETIEPLAAGRFSAAWGA